MSHAEKVREAHRRHMEAVKAAQQVAATDTQPADSSYQGDGNG